jgi:hypothetical protein
VHARDNCLESSIFGAWRRFAAVFEVKIQFALSAQARASESDLSFLRFGAFSLSRRAYGVIFDCLDATCSYVTVVSKLAIPQRGGHPRPPPPQDQFTGALLKMDVAIDNVAAKAARSHEGTPPARDPASLEAEFSAFNKKREEEKLLLYERVFSVGLRLLVVGLVLALIAIFIGNFAGLCDDSCRNGPKSVAGSVVLVACFIPCVAGFVMLTSVPPREFDIDAWFRAGDSMGNRLLAKALVRLVISLLLLVTGCMTLMFLFPFVFGLPILAFASWVLWEITPHEISELRRRCGLRIVSPAARKPPESELLRLFQPRYITTAAAGAFSCALLCSLNLNLVSIIDYTPKSFDLEILNSPITQRRLLRNGPASILIALFLAASISTWRAAAHGAAADGRDCDGPTGERPLSRGTTPRRRDWWRTAALYNVLSFVAITYAACMVNYNFFSATDSVGDFVGQVGTAIVVGAAGLWGLLGGRTLAFRAAARQFESSHRISDGAKLAALVARAPAIDWATRSRWIMRRGGSRGSSKLESDAARGCVNRNFWLLGHIVALDNRSGRWAAQPPPSAGEPDPEVLCLEIIFAEDADEQWTAKFSSDKLVLQRLAASARDFFSAEHHFVARAATGAEFSAWREMAFRTTDLVDSNVGGFNQSVVIRVTNLGGTADEAEMASVAKKNLRFFPFPCKFPKFPDDLLVTSPRNVAESDAERVFKLSRPLDLTLPANSGRLVDYFLSHCWDEDEEGARKKASALQAFVDKAAPQSKNAAEVSLWFDKVCIDKRKGSDDRAITLLPVTVGMCRKVIVLLSPNYLKRIWCVWEIESIFTFCIKELAVDRVVVVNAGGGANLRRDALRWSLDAAHCFDPNEELRLRRLAVVIGEDRFVESVQTLSMCPVIDAAYLMQELES